MGKIFLSQNTGKSPKFIYLFDGVKYDVEIDDTASSQPTFIIFPLNHELGN